MADEIDVANELFETEVRRALSKRQSMPNSPGSKFCIECGDDMPPAREKLGFKYCVPCASERERRQSLFADE